MTQNGRKIEALLRKEQVANWLNIEPETLDKWRQRGVGPAWVRISRNCIRYAPSEIERYLAEKTVTGSVADAEPEP